VAEIKAIETIYNGYKFRSRLEARWAVFFDALGIKYEYEKEGYDLGELGWYLPDFWLPDLKMWVEVKGQSPTDEECEKMSALVLGVKGRGAIVTQIPEDNSLSWNDNYEGMSYRYQDGIGFGDKPDEPGVCEDCTYYFCKCSECGKIGFHFDGRIRQCQCGEHCRDDDTLIAAYTKARQARFEHGEEPRLNNTPSSNKPEEVKKQARKPITVWDIREKARQAEAKSRAKG